MDRLLPSDAKAAYIKAQPLGRLGHVRDIADATVYLFSDTGSYVTGQVLVGKCTTPLTSYQKLILFFNFSGWRELAHVSGWRIRRKIVLPGLPSFGSGCAQRDGQEVQALSGIAEDRWQSMIDGGL